MPMLSSSIDYFGNMDDSLSLSGLLFTPFCRSASKKAESSVEDCLKSTRSGYRSPIESRCFACWLVIRLPRERRRDLQRLCWDCCFCQHWSCVMGVLIGKVDTRCTSGVFRNSCSIASTSDSALCAEFEG